MVGRAFVVVPQDHFGRLEGLVVECGILDCGGWDGDLDVLLAASSVGLESTV